MRDNGGGHTSVSVTLFTFGQIKAHSCRSLNKLEYKPAHASTHMKQRVFWSSWHKHEGHPVCVGGVFWSTAQRWLWWMICQDNVPLMTSSPLPRRQTACVWVCVCVCVKRGETEVIFACVLVDVWVCVALSAYSFWHPSITRVWAAVAAALHESAVWGQGVKHSDPRTTFRGHPSILMGKSVIRLRFRSRVPPPLSPPSENTSQKPCDADWH